MNVLLNSMVGILSQCICISNHRVHFKYNTKKSFNTFSIEELKKVKQKYYLIHPWFFIFYC